MVDLAPQPQLRDASVIVDSGDWVLLGTQFFQAAEVRRAENQVTVEVASTDAAIDAAIQKHAPRGSGTPQQIPFAHRNDAHIVRVLAVESRTVQETCIWTIKLSFEPRARRGLMDEVSIRMHDGNLFTGDDAARTRAARILFEPSPPMSRSAFSTNHMLEMQIRGQGPVIVERCFVQDTYAQLYSIDPDACARQARLVAIWALRATNTVEFVERLAFGPIESGRLHIEFRGRRHKIYDNVEPPTISLEGDCELLLPKDFRPPSLKQTERTHPESTATTPQTAAHQGHLKVLLVSANPDTTARLRVDREFRDIIGRVRQGHLRDHIRIEQIHAARFSDLKTALLEHTPHILHVSAHGNRDGSLEFEADGFPPTTKNNIVRLLRALKDNLRLVVLNACYSEILAAEIATEVGMAIGMSDAIGDDSAMVFSQSFYEALAFGKPVQIAFDVARASVEDEDVEMLHLYPEEDPAGPRSRPLFSTCSP